MHHRHAAVARGGWRHRRRHRQAAHRLRLPPADDELARRGDADGGAHRVGDEGGTRPFCDAMLAIREEARAIAQGRMDKVNNPLKNAPHTVEDLVGEWNRPYSREAACFPAGAFRVDKYWPPVNRVDNVYGDRNLVCACAPMETYIKAAE